MNDTYIRLYICFVPWEAKIILRSWGEKLLRYQKIRDEKKKGNLK